MMHIYIPDVQPSANTEQEHKETIKSQSVINNSSEKINIDCGFLKNNICVLASDIAKTNCITSQSICNCCIACDRPRRLNIYTAGLILENNTTYNMDQLASSMLEDAKGFGTTLANAFANFFQELPNCQCPGHQDVLNVWTKEYITENLDYVVNWLRVEAHRRAIPFSPMLTRIFLKGLLLLQ